MSLETLSTCWLYSLSHYSSVNTWQVMDLCSVTIVIASAHGLPMTAFNGLTEQSCLCRASACIACCAQARLQHSYIANFGSQIRSLCLYMDLIFEQVTCVIIFIVLWHRLHVMNDFRSEQSAYVISTLTVSKVSILCDVDRGVRVPAGGE